MSPSEPVNSPQDEGSEGLDAYFSSPELAQRTDLLRHLTENSNLIPLIRGIEGMGKSTFITHLLDLAPENWIPVEIISDVMLQPDALLANLARLFDLNDSGSQLMENLTTRFDDLRQDGFLPVIIVDDAHLLPEATVVTLLRLHEKGSNDTPLAQILFFAQPEIEEILKTPQLKVMNQQSLQLLDMPVFTKEQTEHFLQHLLTIDESSSRPLSHFQIEKIYLETGGVPGQIKDQAIGLMGSDDKDEKLQPAFDFTAYISLRSAIVSGIVLVVVLLGLVYQDSINNLFSGTKEIPDPNQDASVTAAGKSLPLALPDSPVEAEPVVHSKTVPGPTGLAETRATSDGGADARKKVGAALELAGTADGWGKDSPTVPMVDEKWTFPEGIKKTTVVAKAPGIDEIGHPENASTEQSVALQKRDTAKAAVLERFERLQRLQQESSGLSGPVPAAPTQVEKKAAAPQENLSAAKVGEKTAVPKHKVSTKIELKTPVVQPRPRPPVTSLKKKPPVVKVAIEPKTPVAAVKQKPPVVQVKVKPKPSVVLVKKKPSVAGAPAPVTTRGDRSRNLPGRGRAASVMGPAPVEERSTTLIEKRVSSVKVVQSLNSPAPTSRKISRGVPKTGLPGILREEWLLKQRSSSYTIQLVGLQDEQGVKAFIRRHPLSGLVAYYRTTRGGKAWFPVVYGIYPDKNRAIQARDTLPLNLRKSGVWLRRVGSVQKEIRVK